MTSKLERMKTMNFNLFQYKFSYDPLLSIEINFNESWATLSQCGSYAFILEYFHVGKLKIELDVSLASSLWEKNHFRSLAATFEDHKEILFGSIDFSSDFSKEKNMLVHWRLHKRKLKHMRVNFSEDFDEGKINDSLLPVALSAPFVGVGEAYNLFYVEIFFITSRNQKRTTSIFSSR